MEASREMDEAPHSSCLATIDRSIRQSAKNKPLVRGRIRIRMAFLGNREAYAWPEATRFEKGPLALIARGDAGSSNGLSGWGRIAAGLPESSFSEAGQCAFDGRRGTRFDVHVPWSASTYSAAIGIKQLVLPYIARFCVDPASAELMSLEVQARAIEAAVFSHLRNHRFPRAPASRDPPGSRLNRANSPFSTKRVTCKLPRTKLSDCQPYADETPADSAAAAGQAASRALSAELTLDMKLETPITFVQSAVGDTVTARLQRAIRTPDFELPKGTLIHGRIGRLEEQFLPERHYVVGLELDTITVGSAEVRFHARLTGPALSYDRRPDAMLRQDPLMAPVWDARGLEIDDSDPTARLGVFRVSGRQTEYRSRPAHDLGDAAAEINAA